MYDRIQPFSLEELTEIHDASIYLLETVGVQFDDDEAVDLFKSHGFKIDGKIVFFTEKNIRRALDTAPSNFKLIARDPAKSVAIGGDDFALAPGYGASFISLNDGLQRKATLADYHKFCQLVQTSDVINMNGFLMVSPWDVPAKSAHLEMLYSNITFCDKPFMASPLSREAAYDAINMLAIMLGGLEELEQMTVTASLITPFSPFRYTTEMAGSIIALARYNQACIFGALLMGGSSGPTNLAGLLAQQNAEILAGVTLAQLANPGAPVVVGGTSAILDMRTGCLAMGSPEVVRLTSATIQLAKFYNLPARAGCSNTGAHLPDAQAGFESALTLMTAIRNGSNFVLHAAGILGSYNAMSFEKFTIDEELCRMVIEALKPIKIDRESIDTDFIMGVGIGGDYLAQTKTLEQCRTAFFLPNLVNRKDYKGWQEEGQQRIEEKAVAVLDNRLSSYIKPAIDPQIDRDLRAYVDKK